MLCGEGGDEAGCDGSGWGGVVGALVVGKRKTITQNMNTTTTNNNTNTTDKHNIL